MNRHFLSIFFILICQAGFTQPRPVYSFQQDDTEIKQEYYEQALRKKNEQVTGLGKKYRDDYKEIYENRFREIASILKTGRAITAPDPHNYLQAILQRIVDANAALQGKELRVLFTRDWLPNAFSMGEGTLVINAGLMVYLANEAELVFVLCHELAHEYLGHYDRAISRNVEYMHSDEFKAEVKRLSKLQYRAGENFETLLKKFSFDNRRHKREGEAEADRWAFQFMKNTGFATTAITTCLQKLDKIDDSLLYGQLKLEQAFNFPTYPFRKKWIEQESVLFGEMRDDDSPLSKAEKDSLKTHPDCEQRIGFLHDSIKLLSSRPDKNFMVNEDKFNQLKKEFYPEMTEQVFRSGNLGRNLYYNLLMLQGEVNTPLAVYSIIRALNLAYERQRDHTLGKMYNAEARNISQDYNLLLRMLGRLKLDEIASLSYQFCKKYENMMSGYEGFREEMAKAEKFVN